MGSSRWAGSITEVYMCYSRLRLCGVACIMHIIHKIGNTQHIALSSKNNRARPSTSTGNQSNSSTHHSLRVRSAVQRHQSPERPILCQISSLMHPKIQRRRVIVNVLHPSCVQPCSCSLAVLDPRVGHTMDVLSPFIPVLCHSD